MRSILSTVWRWGELHNSLLTAAQVSASSGTTSVRHYIKQHPRQSWKYLTSKRGNQNFWKGRGVQGAGANSSKGKYQVLPSHSPHYIIPDVRNCKVCFFSILSTHMQACNSCSGPVVDTVLVPLPTPFTLVPGTPREG